jgi:predicted MFS family arabinose efflux permease
MFGSLTSGTTVNRLGPIRVSQLGLLFCALGLSLCAVPSLPVIAIGALLIGLGYGPITPASSQILARTTKPSQMALVFSIKQSGVPLGAMMAGAVIPTLMINIDWQLSLIAVALACLIFAALSQPLRPSFDDQRQAGLPFELGTLTRPIRMVLGHRTLATMATCSFMFSMVQLSLTTYLVTYLHEDLSYGMVSAGLLLSVTQIGGIGGRIAWGLISDRWLGAQKTLMLLACLMALSALVTALFLPQLPLWAIWITLVVFGASAIGWNGVYLAEVARQAPPGMASVATGGTLAVTFLGVVFGSPLVGWISNATGTYRSGFIALSLLAFTCFSLLTWLSRGKKASMALKATS